MTSEELFNICDLKVATTQRLATSELFECENEDLNDFFAKDCVKYSERLLGKTYLLCLKENPKIIVAAFTVSNDGIRMTNKLNEDYKHIFLTNTSLEDKRLRRFPAVLIGRLATNKAFAGKGFGSAVMYFIKTWFRFNNKTGCRFLIVHGNRHWTFASSYKIDVLRFIGSNIPTIAKRRFSQYPPITFFSKTSLNIWQLQKKVVILHPER